MVLVQTETGQTRVIRFEEDFSGTESELVMTHLPGVTGVNTGLIASGSEHVIISSVTRNAIGFLNVDDLSLTNFSPRVPGPVTAIPLRETAGDPPSIHQVSQYGEASEVVQRYSDLFSVPPSTEGSALEGFPVYDLQPALIPGSPNEKAGVFSVSVGGATLLYEIRPIPGNVDYDVLPGIGTIGEKIVTECRGSDGRTCVIRYQSGASEVIIVTRPYFGFGAESFGSNALPFPIGSIAAVSPGTPGAPHGVIITSLDGSTAIYAHLDAGQTLSTQATFTPDGANLFTGFIAIPGRGFLSLEGPAGSRVSTSWRGFQSSGGSWDAVGSGAIGNWPAAQANFATLFWFKGTPLIDPTAEMIKLETRGDWTRKTTSDPIPAQIELSELLTAEQGLTPFSMVAPTAPTGANFLLTSQREDQVSITALDTNLAILSPSLTLNPPSGDYDHPITVTALFDEGANELFYREESPGNPWLPFETLTIGYPSSWLFYARNQSTGANGPILRRDYTFSAVNPNSLDSDRDGVPDYVEREFGLDPAGGADSDGDFQSDLEEILAETDPADHTSNTPPTVPRTPPFLGEGFELVAQAYNASGQGASPANDFSAATTEDDFPGETLRAHDMQGRLLAEENVRELTTPPVLAGSDGASMQIGTPVLEAAWITLSSPTSFGVLDVPAPARTGREIFKVIQRPVNPVAEVVTVPGGVDRSADAAAWVTEAQAAHGAHLTVDSLTELRPVDNALAALAEQALFSSLLTLPSAEQTSLGVPPGIEDFTLFPQRRGESARVPFSSEMWEALRDAGCDFPAMLQLLGGAAADATVIGLANAITTTHVANSGTNPLMALPLDAFRSIIRNGAILDPAPGDPARPDPYAGLSIPDINSAKTTFDDLLAQVPGTKRLVEIWFIVIASSSTPLHNYDYLRQGLNGKVWLLDRFGERVILEQGLGLGVGTVFEIRGFTDVSAPIGFTGFEPIRIESVVSPQASDTDTNANLLDDGWENVFFGDLGVVGPYDPHPDTGHSYLQYQLSGADPRSGSLGTTIVSIFPENISLVWVPAANAYELTFDFPAEFVGSFDFALESSTTLTGFGGAGTIGPVTEVSPGSYKFQIETIESNLPANFFRISISLK